MLADISDEELSTATLDILKSDSSYFPVAGIVRKHCIEARGHQRMMQREHDELKNLEDLESRFGEQVDTMEKGDLIVEVEWYLNGDERRELRATKQRLNGQLRKSVLYAMGRKTNGVAMPTLKKIGNMKNDSTQTRLPADR